MKILIVGIIVLALAVAGVSTYLIQTFSGEANIEELQKEALKPKIRVLVATKELRPGQKLGPDNLEWQYWVDESLNPKYIVVEKDEEESGKMEEFTGSVVRNIIHEGEPILGSKVFKSEGAGFLAGVLESGMRAVTFTVGATTGSAGFILPGDRVDILLTHNKVKAAIARVNKGKKKKDNEPLVVLSNATETIVRNLKVLAINAFVDFVEGNNIPAKNVTLELTPKQAELLITARTMGKLSVVLRSLETPEGETEELTYTSDVEVSPFIQNLNKILASQKAAQEKKRQKQLQDEAAERERAEASAAERAEASAAAGSRPRPFRPRKKKKPVKIFWGGKGTLEEVKAGPKKVEAAPK
ncbi:MAG: Flp pilus assembly protein CpaB [Proteobacteria bacterium]|nr:Flp pilus assembly protein CpaB [Pseudomonadota bacterium]